MNKADWTGRGKNSIYSTLGASNHSNYARAEMDYYATDPRAIDDLFYRECFSQSIWEPACGEGHLSKRMIENNKYVYSTDLIDRGYGDDFFDFLTCGKPSFEKWYGDIITNPPYKYAQEFVEKSHELLEEGSKLAMFLKLTFLEGQKRRKMFEKYPPKKIYVYSQRIQCALNGNPEMFLKSSAACYAWFVWEKGNTNKPIIDWI